MSESPTQPSADILSQVYASLIQQDVEQFYTGYQLWSTQQHIAALQEQIETLQQQIAENAELLQQVRPPAVAFATLARLQANGVDDVDLLDRLLERGETWLDLNMQRLDYCEQLDVIHGNYTEWCGHALEGAYDWIDSMRDAFADTEPRSAISTAIDETIPDATEELLLRKLTSEEELPLAGTLESEPEDLATPTSEIAHLAEDVHLPTETDTETEAFPTISEPESVSERSLDSTLVIPDPGVSPPIEANATVDVPTEQNLEPTYIEFIPTVEEPFPVATNTLTDSLPVADEQESEPTLMEFTPAPEIPLLAETSPATDSFSVPAEEVLTQESAEPAPVPEVEAPLPTQTSVAADSSSAPEAQESEAEQPLETTLVVEQPAATELPLVAESAVEAEAAPAPEAQESEAEQPLETTLVVEQPATELPLVAESAVEAEAAPAPEAQGSEAEQPLETTLVVEQPAATELPLPIELETTTDSSQAPEEQITLEQKDMQESALGTMLEPLEPFASVLEHPIDLGFVSILETTTPNETSITDSFQGFSEQALIAEAVDVEAVPTPEYPPTDTVELVSTLETTSPNATTVTDSFQHLSEPTPTVEFVSILETTMPNEMSITDSFQGLGEPVPTVESIEEKAETPAAAGEATDEHQIEQVENTAQPAQATIAPPQLKQGFLQRLLALFRRN